MYHSEFEEVSKHFFQHGERSKLSDIEHLSCAAEAEMDRIRLQAADHERRLEFQRRANERSVFHGTAESSMDGLLAGVCAGVQHVGDASYSTSTDYSKPGGDGQQFVFYVQILVGEPCLNLEWINRT
jgi:hypothetical protein